MVIFKLHAPQDMGLSKRLWVLFQRLWPDNLKVSEPIRKNNRWLSHGKLYAMLLKHG